MSKTKKILITLFVVALYSLASTMEYNDQVMMQKLNAQNELNN